MTKKILAINGSPRPSGNTTFLLGEFVDGALSRGAVVEQFTAKEMNIQPCTGCLRCNLIKRCSQSGDEWAMLSQKILESDVLVFAAPIYFHHVPAPLKMILDRFRSFVHVQITETGIIHTPHAQWNKDFVLILPMGSPDPGEARPVIELFQYMTSILGSGNRLHVITATRLAVAKQVAKTKEELKVLYPKLGLAESLVEMDIANNRRVLESCRELGMQLSSP